MTAAELIEALRRFPPNAQVVLWDYAVSGDQEEMQVMQLKSEDVRSEALVWRDRGGMGWVELARGDSTASVPGIALGPKEWW